MTSIAPDRPSPAAIDTVRVALDARGYDIRVGPGLIATAGAELRGVLTVPRVMVVTDAHVAALHLPAFLAGLDAAGIAHGEIVLPPGEATKDFAHLARLTDELVARGIDRRTTVVALGGGVVGDLAGFAAAVVLRGLDFVQAPTTLLAQVDSAVGGKTAINLPAGKNLVGAFHQPRLVLADTGVLDTLPRRELLAGYAEVVKYGLINDPAFFAWLEANGARLIAGDAALRRHAIATSCRAKAAIVAADERETGDRALLNLGHTFGHALEAEAGYGDRLLHGEAVAIGMALAFDLSARLGLCPAEDALRVRNHLRMVGLGAGLGDLGQGLERPEPERLIRHMGKDKKVQDGAITFILARGIGRAFITRAVPADALAAVLAA